jgi:class 3 adenylate cyclase/tetratricopeptide (TPR) repeat protein
MADALLECPRCATAVSATAKFCSECGLALGVRSSRGVLVEPERKYVTLLFSDIRDSTRIVRDLDAEDATERLRPAIDLMVEAVHRAGGTVNRNTGDGILAVFGAPQAVEDHAIRACRAAILMHGEIRRIDPELELRIGIHSGEILTRVSAGDFGPVYDLSGASLHLARRLEQAAPSGGTLISDATWEQVRGGIVALPRGSMVFKGFEQPVETHHVVGYVPGSRWAARATADLSPLVGRDDVLAAVRERLARARRGHGQAVTLVGAAGVGKSRLVHEILSAPGVASGWQVWELDAEPLDGEMPFSMARALVQRWLGHPDAKRPDELDAVLSAKLKAAHLEGDEVATPLRALLDVPQTSSDWTDLAQVHRRARIVSAIGATIRSAAREQPLLLIIEDAQWCDRESWQVLEALLSRLGSTNMAIILTRRPDSEKRLPELPNCAELHLSELDTAAAEQMLRSLLGSDATIAPVMSAILQRSGRVPLYIEEIVSHLSRLGVIAGKRGQFKALRPATETDLPRSVQAIAAARVDALPPIARSAVVAASVIGRRIEPGLLAVVTGDPEEEVAGTLRRLAIAGVFEDSLDPSNRGYEFRHDVIRQAAYESLVRDRRRTMHGRVADGIERLYAGELAEWVPDLAHHAGEAWDWERACRYCREAAERALEKAAYDSAGAFCDKALAHVARLPQDADTIRRAVDIHLLGRAALAPVLGAADWLRHAEEAERLAESIQDTSRQLLAGIHRSWAASYMARPLDAIESGRTALARAEDAGSVDTILMARTTCGQALFAHGDYHGAVATFNGALDLLKGERMLRRFGTTVTTSITCLVGRSNARALLGEFAAADEDARQVGDIFAKTALPLDAAYASYAAGFALLHRMDFAGAEAKLAEAVERCRDRKFALPFSLFANSLGAALHAQGKNEAAAALLAEAIASADSMSFVMAKVSAELNLGYVALAMGRSADAQTRAQAGLAFSRERGLRFTEVLALRLLARCALAAPAPQLDKAIGYLGDAVTLTRAMTARPNEAITRLVLATVLLKTTQLEQGHQEAKSAAEIFDELGMAGQATQARSLAAAASAAAGRSGA